MSLAEYDSQPTAEPLSPDWLRLLNVLEAAYADQPAARASAIAMVHWLAQNADVRRRRDEA